uniref:Uncharacterized protein n=1 Tax=Anguilla anguilla TaxID=7936 RepID=A0A0E9UM02_ANGAN
MSHQLMPWGCCVPCFPLKD